MPKIFKPKSTKVTTISPFMEGVQIAFIKYNGSTSLDPENARYHNELGYYVALKNDEGDIFGNVISRSALMAKDAHAEDLKNSRPQFSGSVTEGIAKKGEKFMKTVLNKWCVISEVYPTQREVTINGERTLKDCNLIAIESLDADEITKEQIAQIQDDLKKVTDNWAKFIEE